MKSKVLFSVASVLACFCIEAKTVAWWHLNDLPNGVVAANGESVAVNACDSSKLSLKAGVLNIDNNLSNGRDECLPIYTNAFPDYATWCASDGTKGSDGRGVYFNPKMKDGTQGAGGVLYTELTDDLKLSSFTVELFFKSDFPAKPTYWSNLMVLGGPGSSDTWGLRIQANGTIAFRKTYTKEDGSTGNESLQIKGVNAYDGKWHHLAFTYDGNTKTGTLYYDYSSKSSKTFSYDMEYVDGSLLEIGAFNKANYGRWCGWVDEVRISDTVLGKNDFLRPSQNDSFVKKSTEISSPDTVFFASFDTAPVVNEDSFFGALNTLPYDINESTGTNSYVGKVMASVNGKWPELCTDGLPSAQFHSGIFATKTADNLGCWNFDTNSPGLSSMINIDDRVKLEDGSVVHDFTSGSSTFEMFIKLEPSLDYDPYLICQHKSGGSGSLWLRLLKDRKIKLSVLPKGGDKMEEHTSSQLSAGEWHHIAVVFDHEMKTTSFYVDYGLIKTFTDVIPISEVDARYSPYLQLFGGYGANHPQQMKGAVDSVRLTKRALGPHEFLKKNAVEPEPIGRTRAWISFDGDYLVKPRTNDIPAGTVSSGDVEFSRNVPGAVIVDGDENVLMETNRASAKFPGSLFFRHNLLTDSLDMRSQTLEFYVKMDAPPSSDWMNLVRFNVGASSGGDVVYGVRYRTNKKLSIRFDAVAESEKKQYPNHFNQGAEFENANLDDGKWHHVALTFDSDEEKSNTSISFYKDRKFIGTKTVNGLVRTVESGAISSTSFTIGSTELTGYIDEVRLSQGILDVKDMLRATHVKRPFAIIFR
jgi:hypothetical protein